MRRAAGKIMETLTGQEARQMIRSGKMKGKPTMGWCRGWKQANMAMLHKEIAKDFAEFAVYNPGCLPILYQSKPGETGCQLATGESDIRTDLPAYKIWKDGEFVKVEDNVLNYNWKDMVSFYIGCSFSFDDLLIRNNIPVRNVEKKVNVPMYKTRIHCHAVGPFSCNMIVSMRPIPESQLPLVCNITYQLPDVHGGPVHIGNPDVILENGVENQDFGDKAEMIDGDVPVFWACGVTNSEAIKSAKSPLAITHHPGMMYITDTPQEEYNPSVPAEKECEVIKFSEKGQRFTILSSAALKTLCKLEESISDDPGDRGVKHLLVPGDFPKSAAALSHASSVALTTGMACHTNSDVKDETDGLPGVFSLAAMLQALGKKVTLIVDRRNIDLTKRILKKEVSAEILQDVPLITYCNESGEEHSLLDEEGKPKYDVILATERSGRTQDGRYYNMKAVEVKGNDPIDNMFQEAANRKDVITIGIGDGGNELGMGKVREQVEKFIPNGQKIACNVAADLVISTGICNWGCYALSLALYMLRRCQVHDRYYRHATGPATDVEKMYGWAVPTIEREEQNLRLVESEGVKDGRRPDQVMSVDGFMFHPFHADKIKQMRGLIF